MKRLVALSEARAWVDAVAASAPPERVRVE